MFRKSRFIFSVALLVVLAAVPSQARVYSLDECVELALESNIALAKASESLTGARADVLSSWSGVLPHVSGSISNGETTTIIDGDESSSEGASGSLSLSQTLFDGSTFANIAAASRGRTAVVHSLEATRREIIFGTKQGYYGLLKALALRDVQSEALELAQEQLRKTDSLFELGSASRSDLLKAQVQVGQAELALISAERSAETARAGLCYTLGIDIATALEVVDPPEDERETEVTSYDLEESISRRPDVQAAEESVVAARRSLLAAKAGRWPDLGFSLSYSRSAGSLGELNDDIGDNHTRSMNLSLSVPIFNGLGTKASIDRGKSTLRTSELSLRDSRLWAEYEIETARLVVLEQKESVQVAEKAVAQAEEDLRVSEERFRLRAASMLELIDARVAYSRVRADLVKARYDYEIAKAELTLALGY